MNSLTRTIIYNAHPASLVISVGAVMGGLTASVIRGGITLFPAIMTILFAVLLQISANLYHGYVDLCYGAGENISGMKDRDSRSFNSSKVVLMKIVANGFGILTVTAGLSLFPFIGWLGVGYFALVTAMLYFYFAGPRPVIRTEWSLAFTFILFGPIAVSGTALIQNPYNPDWLPIAVYSFIIGLLAVNAHIAVQYIRYEEDRMNGRETLVTKRGGHFTRFVYLSNAILVTAILIIRPSAIEFVTPWVGIILGICLLVSSAWVFSMMHRNPTKVSTMVRTATMWQYITVTITLLCIVLYSMDDFKMNVIQLI